MTQHTPGPWKAQRDLRHYTNTGTLHDGSPKAWGVYSNQRVACVESNGPAWDQDTEAEANARLMAAAPELLEALKLCEAELFAQCAELSRAMWYVEQARAAIAKATGGQP